MYKCLLVFIFSEPILSTVKSKLPFRSHKRKSQDPVRSSESYQKIADSDQSYKPEVEVSDILQDRTDSESTLVIGQDPKRIAENQVQKKQCWFCCIFHGPYTIFSKRLKSIRYTGCKHMYCWVRGYSIFNFSHCLQLINEPALPLTFSPLVNMHAAVFFS